MVHVLITKKNPNNTQRGWEKTLGGDGGVYGIVVVIMMYTYL